MLPRLLAPVLPTAYSPRYLPLAKAHALHEHLGFPYHTFVHCKGFAPAAPRRARTSISVSFSGLPLSRPVWILGLVSHYLTNNLIHRRLILWRNLSKIIHSRIYLISGIILSFPRLFLTKGQIIDVLLSILPRVQVPSKLAWLNRILIAATLRRINGNYFYDLILYFFYRLCCVYYCRLCLYFFLKRICTRFV